MQAYARNLRGFMAKTIATRPLIYLNGPRQCGKSTLAQDLGLETKPNYLSFDSPLVLAAAKADPAAFIRSLPAGRLNIIDEVQLAKEIYPYLKIAVDENRAAGMAGDQAEGQGTRLYLLTGSANLLALPTLAEALVGRMSVLTLLPFSSAELLQNPFNFVEALFRDKLEYRRYDDYDLVDIISNATFPEPALHRDIEKTPWFDNYLSTLIQRDVQNIADIRNPVKVVMLLSVLAMRAGGLLNNSAVAQETGLDIKTYERYKAAAINTFLIFELPPWAKPNRLNKRFTRSPKLFFNDTNLLAYLLRRDLRDIYATDRITMGHLFENFIATEIMKNAAALPDTTVSHFRTSDQKEVDFVLEKTTGDTIGIEVKLDATPNNHDFYGLKLLKEAVGDKFKRGLVLYSGNEVVSWGEDLWAVPACYMWKG
ncbi:MAG: ATP-binding protein [Treponema sp.]|jgi:predicted AAA+ superfamily ATPase|nr:ATP-binding protein [Treponema sp.]